ncbi:MAG: hypothetical protein JW814_11815 [Candidatus Krumholzibacteriota bacterium]|nr:hypothetical protein [Candidatus Krumholzibacteriota bacterium]
MDDLRRAFSYFVVCVFLAAQMSCSEKVNEPDTEPPAVGISYPTDLSTITDQVHILAECHDENGISIVQFFVDDVLIAEDSKPPYDQIWYTGFWLDRQGYVLSVVAKDQNGNIGTSAPVTVTLAKDSECVPELIEPENGSVINLWDEYSFSWRPVHGARGYILKVRTSDFEFNQYFCTSGGPQECFVNLKETIFSGPIMPYNAPPFGDWSADGYWSVQAYWSSYYLSSWSEERYVRFSD